jgi:hypothetical protein
VAHRQILKMKEKEIKERGLGKKFFFDEEGQVFLRIVNFSLF